MTEPTSTAENRQRIYQLAFVKKCFRLLALGYECLEASSLSEDLEETITGLLVGEMKRLTESEEAPQWMESLHVSEDARQEVPGRVGRDRPKVDIEVCWVVQRGRRPRFHCEAKRLYRSDSVSRYLGTEGLGLFVAGEYGREEQIGGMIGYVQTQSPGYWMKRIACRLRSAKREECACLTESGLESKDAFAEGLKQVCVSCHKRVSVEIPIEIYHAFLIFH